MEILEKKSKTRGNTQPHFWKKNPTNFLKNGFRGVTQRHLWKKIPEYFNGSIFNNYENFLFPGNHPASFMEKNST